MFVLLFVVLIGNVCLAQPRFKIDASGTIVDSKTQEPLYAATVKVTSADGGTGTFGITDTLGVFTFTVERPGKYTLELSFVGYKPLTKEVGIFPGRGAKLGTFKMEEDPTYLREVETVARNQRVKQVGDTIVYNADAYKVQDGATAEDLVAKMPGIEVTNEGVKAQGETVEKITVDGKAFFENDPKLALRTLPAEVVQSVSVFDKKSDQAEFTGFDDGNTVKAMDLTTKSYRRNGVFGRVYGSIGDNFDLDHLYWNAGFNLNSFNGTRRISVLGMTNNVNQQDFTFDDLMQSGGMGGGRPGRGGGPMAFRTGGQAGVSRANAFGLNFNDSYLDDKLEVQGSYFFNNTRTYYENESQQDFINTPRSSLSQSQRLSHNYSHRLDMRITYKPNDNNELMFRPSLNLQKSDRNGWSTQYTWRSPLDSILAMSLLQRQDVTLMQNFTNSSSRSDNTSWNAGGSLVWRHKFAKQGRTLSSEVQGRISGSESETNDIRLGKTLPLAETYQNSLSDQDNYSLGGNLQYTEPLGERQQLSVRYNVNYNQSDNDRQVGFAKDYNEAEGATFEQLMHAWHTRLDSVDAANSSQYISRNLRHGGELAYRLHTETVNLTAGLNLEASILDGEQKYIFWDASAMKAPRPDYTTSKTFFSALPNVRFEWKPKKGSSVNIDYRARAQAPSIGNLQQSVNTANELSYSTGNKDLDESISHNVSVRYIYSNMEMATNFMVFGNFGLTQHSIGNQYITNNSDASMPLSGLGWVSSLSEKDRQQYENLELRPGARFTRPVNMEGSRSAMLGMVYGFPFDPLYSNVNISLFGNYSVSPSQQLFYSNAADLTDVLKLDTKVRNLSLSPNISITSNISQDLDFTVRYAPTFQKVVDTDNEANNYEYFNQTASAKLNWTFWKNFTTEQSVDYSYFGGKSMPTAESEWIWNMSFGKKFLKQNKAELKLQIYDVLNTRKGFSRSVGDTSITQSYTNYMPRYFMLTFSYKIANYKGSSQMKERSGGMRGGFGGPMMF